MCFRRSAEDAAGRRRLPPTAVSRKSDEATANNSGEAMRLLIRIGFFRIFGAGAGIHGRCE